MDELLDKPWNRAQVRRTESPSAPAEPQTAPRRPARAGRASRCRTSQMDGQAVTLVALPLIFEQFREAGKAPDAGTARELLRRRQDLQPGPARTQRPGTPRRWCSEYAAFCAREEVPA